MVQTNSNNRIIFFDVLRIIAAFAVVFSHVSSQRFHECFPSDEWITRMIYDAFGRWSVPVFVMISGALFLDESKKIDIKRLYTKNIARIIIVFLFWSFIYAIYDGLYKNGLIGFVLGTIHGPFHFWFLKMLIGLYIVVPILRAVVNDKKLEQYFLLVAMLTTFIIPLLFPVLGYYSVEAKDFVTNYYSSLELNIVSGYIGLFVLGHYLSEYRVSLFSRKLLYSMGILSIIAVSLITYIVSYSFGKIYGQLYDSLNIFTLFKAVAVFVFVKSINISTKYHPSLKRVSKTSLGIYLLHVLILHVANDYLGVDSSLFNPAFFIPLYSLFVFIISFVIVSILSRIPIMKSFLI